MDACGHRRYFCGRRDQKEEKGKEDPKVPGASNVPPEAPKKEAPTKGPIVSQGVVKDVANVVIGKNKSVQVLFVDVNTKGIGPLKVIGEGEKGDNVQIAVKVV